jgi:hypothetical protein
VTTDTTRQALEALDNLMNFAPAHNAPLPGMVRGGPYIRLDDAKEAVRAALATPVSAATAEAGQSRKYFTVVFRDLLPDEVAFFTRHVDKVCAVSWSHALDDRDAAIRALASPAQPAAPSKAAEAVGVLSDERIREISRTHWDGCPISAVAFARKIEAELAALPTPGSAAAEPVAWRDHVEERIRTWRQSTMNRSGDRLAIDDFMGQESIDDLVDFVCDEWAGPAPTAPAEQGWLPIETAPKERGSRFIGLTKGGRVVTAMPGWRTYDKGPVFSCWDEDKGDCIVSCELVGWMPLPAPPQPGQPNTSGEKGDV